MEKLSFPPLLTPGFYDFDDAMMKSLCVDNFPESKRRGMLYCNYIQLIEKFRTFTQQFGCFQEIWIDGSYTTSKPEPDDIDILVVCDAAKLDSLPQQFQQQVGMLLNRDFVKQNYNIDVLVLMKNHPNPSHDYDVWRSYWRGWFGFDREENPKGIMRIPL
ncbi:DUF6932 family protein [Pectobacterium sp. LFLA-215]|uniref:DUF6932 family protein n=1 Tax=Pectobacterium sp. LFLA-215 TaxID=3419008 RepID=UPI003F5C19EF